jgi:hypothetical protein
MATRPPGTKFAYSISATACSDESSRKLLDAFGINLNLDIPQEERLADQSLERVPIISQLWIVSWLTNISFDVF